MECTILLDVPTWVLELLTVKFSIRLLCLAFIAILFLQSGLDKVFNWKGNKEYITSYFANSPLKSTTGILFPVITLMEVATGVMAVIGLVEIGILGSRPFYSVISTQLALLTIVMLFFGQRMAKDYAGAAGMVSYFIACVLCMLVFSIV